MDIRKTTASAIVPTSNPEPGPAVSAPAPAASTTPTDAMEAHKKTFLQKLWKAIKLVLFNPVTDGALIGGSIAAAHGGSVLLGAAIGGVAAPVAVVGAGLGMMYLLQKSVNE